jgi:ABC-type transport system involved in multi-copper enzyme maturation permease subunit
MNALIRKEFRLILPVWIAALFVAAVPPCFVWLFAGGRFDDPHTAFLTCVFALGTLFVPLATFGQELSAGTFSLLLSQPASRLRIWRIKVGVLAIAMLSIWLALILSCTVCLHGDPRVAESVFLAWGLIPLVSFAGGLWTTLLLRQVAAAFWFTLLVPFSISVVVVFLSSKYPSIPLIRPVATLLSLYAVAGFLWARRMFLRAQDTAWTGGTISLPAWLRWGTRTRFSTGIPRRRPLRALVAKEFQSHHVSLFLAGMLFVLHWVAIGVRKMEHDPTDPGKVLNLLLGMWWVLWLALPLVVGGVALAEERKQGTLESQLCLPTSRRSQFTVKLVVAMLLGVLLGGVLPMALERIGAWAGVPSLLFDLKEGHNWGTSAGVCMAAAALVLVSFYASSLARNLLQALSAAVLIALAILVISIWALDGASTGFYSGPLFLWIEVPTLVAVAIVLAFNNYKVVHPGPSLWLRNLLALAAAMTATFEAALVIS